MKTNEEYVQSSSQCPFCDSRDIEGQEVNIDGNSAWQEIYCLSCEKEWVDTYRLVGYEPH